MKRLWLILFVLFFVGCSKSVDETTLVQKDGLMYLPDYDKPYTGEVFTKYDTGEKLYTGRYENGLLVSYLYLNKDGSEKYPINVKSLNYRGGLYYKVNEEEPYTGDIINYNSDWKQYTGSIKNGKKDGIWTTWYEPEDIHEYTWDFTPPLIMEKETYNDGKIKKLILWYRNGNKKREHTWGDSGLEGINTDWYENGQKESMNTYKNGKIDGMWTYWYQNGQIRFVAFYDDGDLISNECWDKNGLVIRCSTKINAMWK